MSPQIETISGYSREELSIKWREFFTDNPVNTESQQYAEEAIRTGERQHAYEYEFYKKDGSTILFEVNETPIKDMDGNFLGFVGVARILLNTIN